MSVIVAGVYGLARGTAEKALAEPDTGRWRLAGAAPIERAPGETDEP
jgi:hypothetical protein